MKSDASRVTSNLDINRLRELADVTKAIFEWSVERDHPEKYVTVASQSRVRDFLYTLDLLETVLTRFGVCSQLTSVALGEMNNLTEEGSLFWGFWQIDVEEFFAANLLELCYQLSGAWKRLQKFGAEEAALRILRGPYLPPNNVLLARHKFTHFRPEQFEDHALAEKYSILRRPYFLQNGLLEKELAKDTMPRVAALIRASVDEGSAYLESFRTATIG